MDLALSGARADGSPADQAGDVLRRDHVEEFGAGGHAHLGQVEQQMAGQAQAVVDLVGLVEMRIVDEALPADGGAGLLKVDAHDDAQVGGEFVDGVLEQGGVFARGLGVVDGAGAGQHQQAVVAAVENGRDLAAGVEDGGRGGFGDGKLLLKKDRRKDDFRPLNANIFSGVEHGRWAGRAARPLEKRPLRWDSPCLKFISSGRDCAAGWPIRRDDSVRGQQIGCEIHPYDYGDFRG